mmetsp:Transcript_96253/g.190726  ORF Transcript_96253/g.190726 Transcript_96253/m.190726 type:complete len:159 (+) Transcript_96253:475-951(+)
MSLRMSCKYHKLTCTKAFVTSPTLSRTSVTMAPNAGLGMAAVSAEMNVTCASVFVPKPVAFGTGIRHGVQRCQFAICDRIQSLAVELVPPLGQVWPVGVEVHGGRFTPSFRTICCARPALAPVANEATLCNLLQERRDLGSCPNNHSAGSAEGLPLHM